MSTEKIIPSLGEGVIDSLHDKSISSVKKLEMVQTYFAQAPPTPDQNDLYALSILLEEQLASRDMPSALVMVELMNTHKIPAGKRTVDLFSRMYARHLADNPTKISDGLAWYVEHRHALVPTIPVADMYVELVSRGHVSVAVSLWEVCMEDPRLTCFVPHLAAVDVLVRELTRYEQLETVLALARSKYQDQLWDDAFLATSVMEGFSDRREHHEVLKVHEKLTARNIVVDSRRYQVLVRKAQVYMEHRTGTSTLAPW
ncbi:hypothetical protein DYB25_002342 [Aphanomyces astaci]|uniref:ELYS-like domain-containing protein n=1 Tax=Aphanomyces astaci TaxID=112090 RepID=A0A397CSH5_APHAT|nr:hypothetical protein DYB25_002342 [Aphanomyces astaci]RHY51491.1 hypothetical protein DYB38_003903 [Aphanomyces astaci]RHZ09057.1 hypothetical protein DYB31_001668 [Aphanomyces astaci]